MTSHTRLNRCFRARHRLRCKLPDTVLPGDHGRPLTGCLTGPSLSTAQVLREAGRRDVLRRPRRAGQPHLSSMMTVCGMALAAYFSATAPSRSSATSGCSLCRSSIDEICSGFFLKLTATTGRLGRETRRRPARPAASLADKAHTTWPRSRGRSTFPLFVPDGTSSHPEARARSPEQASLPRQIRFPVDDRSVRSWNRLETLSARCAFCSFHC